MLMLCRTFLWPISDHLLVSAQLAAGPSTFWNGKPNKSEQVESSWAEPCRGSVSLLTYTHSNTCANEAELQHTVSLSLSIKCLLIGLYTTHTHTHTHACMHRRGSTTHTQTDTCKHSVTHTHVHTHTHTRSCTFPFRGGFHSKGCNLPTQTLNQQNKERERVEMWDENVGKIDKEK